MGPLVGWLVVELLLEVDGNVARGAFVLGR